MSWYAKVRRRNYVKNAHAQFWAVKNDLRHPCYSFLLYGYARAALAWTKKKPKKKRSLRNEKLKAKRASETEEQRKERLRIRLEKERERRRTKRLQEEKIRSSETKDHEEQRLATLKRLKRGDESYKKYRSSVMVCFSHSSLYAPNNLYIILIVAFNKMHY